LLEGLQENIEELNDKATEEILEVERKYNRLRKPLYERRNQAIRKIPEFWVKVFTTQEMLAALLIENDLAAFKYLRELNVEDHDDVKSGFKISLTFDPNPFFKNSVLSKEFLYDKDGNLTVIPTRIEWKDGKDLTQKQPSKGKRGREEESESFFTWFNEEDQDLELAEIIKEDLWPNPAKYYFGLEEEAEEEGEDGEGEDGEEGDEGEEGEAEAEEEADE